MTTASELFSLLSVLKTTSFLVSVSFVFIVPRFLGMDPYRYSQQEPSPPQKPFLQLPGMEDGEEDEECDFVFWFIVLLLIYLVGLVLELSPLIDYYLGNKQNHF
ncbi:hypothetical protein L3Y34_016500 [Caenorhabditis briggsae]|uniref:Uncharacterized protein n=1 Tax=Caenorhabditis briggsae TaxID=6238 RepID=A0AAE9DZA4_CAEBR|nr:hypothetical protein L3Y34_016500 [Caenorhabditis briggsae]